MGKIKVILLSTVSLLVIGVIVFVTNNKKQFGSVDFTKMNNNNFGNKSKYDYMKKSKSFQPGDKKKNSPSVLKWNY